MKKANHDEWGGEVGCVAWSLKAVLSAMAVCAALLGLASSARSQSLPPSVRVGMPSADLQSSGLDLRKVPRPERMANGARGVWQQTQAGDDGLVFDVTYFVRGASVDRIDMLLSAAPDGAEAAYERIIGVLRAQFGAELKSHEVLGAAVSDTASWSIDDQDIAAYMTGPRDAEKIRIVYKRRELKDASTL